MTKKSNIAKITKEFNEKVESDAKDIREKYPEIAKMTVAEVVATNLFIIGLRQAITSYEAFNKRQVFYAFKSLKLNNIFEPENFRKEYIACIDKKSKMPFAKRVIIIDIGNDAYRRTILQMMKNHDAIKNDETNINKLTL